MPIDWSKLSDEQLDVARKISATAKDMGVDPDHILPMAYAENQFRAKGTSKKGALGPMQLIPSTAKELGVDPNVLEDNIRGGVMYFKQMYERPDIKGNLDKTYAAYNAGPGTRFVKSGDLKDLPSETLLYIDRIRKLSDQAELPKPESPAAPIESLDVGEIVENIPQGEPSAENMGEDPNRDQFEFNFDEFQAQQDKAAAATPYKMSLEQSVPAGLVGAQTGATAGVAYTLGKTAQNLANAPQTIADAVRSTASGSTNAVKNWITEMGGKDRGAKDYKQAHQFEQGTRRGAQIRNPSTGQVFKPTFKSPRPPVVESAPQPSTLQKTGNLGKTIMSSPVVKGTLGGLGLGMGGAETYERYKQGDTLGTTLSGLSTLGSAASMVPGMQVPGTAVAVGGQGALMMADQVRNKLAQEAQNPKPAPTEAELAALEKQPVGGFYPQRMLKRRDPAQIQQQLTGKLLQDLNGQLADFSKPVQLPSQKQPQQ